MKLLSSVAIRPSLTGIMRRGTTNKMSVKLHHRRSRAALVLVVAFVTLLFGISINQYSLLRLQRDIAISGDLRAVDNLEKDAAAITVVERDVFIHGLAVVRIYAYHFV